MNIHHDPCDRLLILHHHFLLPASSLLNVCDMSAEKCPFQGGGGGTRDTFKEEEGGEYVPCDPRERQEYIWDKILQNRVYETGKEWPSLSDMINVDYSGVFETKGDVQEAKKKV